MLVNIYKHMGKPVKSWSRFYKVVQLHKPC